MAVKKISQRTARQLQKRVRELENLLKNDGSGSRIDTWALNDSQMARVKTANTLGYGLLLFRCWNGTEVNIRAVKI